MRRTPAIGLVLAAATLAGTLSACSGDSEPPKGAAQDFLDSWARGDAHAAAAATDDPAAAEPVLSGIVDALAPTKTELTVSGDGDADDDSATVPYRASWTITGVGAPWTYDGRLSMARTGDDWTVHWEPADAHPDLGEGERLSVERSLPDRADLLDRDGRALFSRTDVVVVGIEPRAVDDLDALAHTLADTLHISADDIVTDVNAAEPDQFVPVITLRRDDYDRVRTVIHDLAGTRFHDERELLGPSPTFGQPFLGTVGDATAEVLEEAGPGHVAGDELGLSGLQRALNERLAGTAGATISAVPDTDTDTDGDSGDATPADGSGTGEVIGQIEPQPGAPVTLTIDRATQTAADRAAASVSTNAAIVALRPSTGDLLAISNGPNAPFDLALEGQYPAGSTFKMITAATLLSTGAVKADDTVGCPARVTVGGKEFQNEDAFDLGDVPLRTAFARSCNSTFTNLSQRIEGHDLIDTAASFGIGAEWDLPVKSFGGEVPEPADEAELAADAIGQGRVLVSPLALALVAATAQHGSTPVPVLITGRPATPRDPSSAPEVPSSDVLDPLRDFMRAVVTEGTATNLADVPGEPVSGKTGTAEYGDKVPPDSHSWFAGFAGDLAFAVLVEDGGTNHTPASAVAKTFLTELATA